LYEIKVTPLLDPQGDYQGNIFQFTDSTEIKRHIFEKKILSEAWSAISSALDINAVLSQIAEQMCNAVRATSAYIIEFDIENKNGTVMAEHISEEASEKEKVSDIGECYDWVEPEYFNDFITSDFVHSHFDDEDIAEKELAYMHQFGVKSILYIPLKARDQTIGTIEIYESRFRREFSKEEISLCQAISSHAALAIENARLYLEAHKRLYEQSVLREAGLAISSALDTNVVLTQIAKQMCVAIQATSAYIADYDLETGKSTVVAEFYSEQASEKEKASDLGETYDWIEPEFFEKAEKGYYDAAYIDDEDISNEELSILQEYSAKSILYIPLKIKNNPIGAVEIYESHHTRKFVDDEISLCQDIAQNAAIALENARLFQETQQRLEEKSILHNAATAISSALDINEVLSKIAEQMCIAVDATSSYICDYDPGQEASTVLAEFISDSACEKEKETDLGATYSEYLEVEKEFLDRLEQGLHDHSHIDEDEIADGERIHMEKYDVKSILYIPLMIKTRPIGFVEIWESRTIRTFKDDEITLCQTIAQQAAIAIDNARLFENAQIEINERKRIEEKLYFDATHDELTGLPNRKVFLERLEQVCKQKINEQERHFAVLFLDFDRFKIVNDSLGHSKGDQLLIESARRLQECLRPSDLLSRLGGDEFVILLEDISTLEYATRIADRIQEVITNPFIIESREIYISTSIGILFDNASNQRAEDLIRDADIAMYRAKDTGRARYAIFAPELHLEITESTIMQYAHSTVTLLAGLQQMGVKLHIDDFGTGYSSLNYLHKFPLNAIKIDRSFISNMQESESSSELVSTIIKLAHTLNMTVIAEGVETDYQKSLLKSMQCEQAQGFYLAKPMDKKSIESLYLRI